MARVAAKSSALSKKSKRATKSAWRGQLAEDKPKSGQVPKWLQWGLFLLCLAAFMINSHQNFSKFMSSTKMVSESIWWDADRRLAFPTMTLCRPQPPVGTNSISDDDLQIEDLLDCTQIESEGCMQIVKDSSNYKTDVYMDFSAHKVTYTRFRGKCFTLTIPFKASPNSFLMMTLKPKPLLIYLHEPDEEFFIHWSWFPNKMAPFVHIHDGDDFAFVSLSKNEVEGNEECKQWTLQNQIDCLRENIEKDYLESELNCTTPWLNSLLMPNPLDRPACKTYDELHLDQDTIAGSMSKHMTHTCPMPCRQVIYDISTEYFRNPADIWSSSTVGIYKEIFIDYSTTSVKKLKTVPASSVNDFISNIGGNLGLFLDFSVISLLYCLASKLSASRKRSGMTKVM